MLSSCQILCILMGRNARRAHGQDVVREGKGEVKERLGWVAISRHILGRAEMPR